MTREENAVQIAASVIIMLKTYVELLRIRDMVENGEVVEGNPLEGILRELNARMEEIQMYQERLGYNVGLPFETDANFERFSIRSGKLVGDLSQVYIMIHPWLEDYIKQKDLSEDAFYKFYVAVFIMQLAEYQYYSKLDELSDSPKKQEDGRRVVAERKPGLFKRFAARFNNKQKKEAA